MKKRNGFTLIELLTVIVLLAIVAIFAVAIISNIVEVSTQKSFQINSELIIKSLNIKKANEEDFDPTTLTEDNIDTVLGLSKDNYENIIVTVENNKVNLLIVGKGKWDGLTAYGADYNVVVVKSSEYSAGQNIDTTGANEPTLLSNMIPVYYDETNSVWRKADSDNTNADNPWYNYATKQWANAVTVNSLPDQMINDLSNNNFDGQLMNGVSYANGGLTFDGVDDYVKLPTLPSTIDWNNGITIEFTAKWTAFQNWSRIFDFANGAGDGNILVANSGTGSNMVVGIHDGPSSSYEANPVMAVASTTSKTYRVVITKQTGAYKFESYVDNVAYTTTTVTDHSFLQNVNRLYNYIGKSNFPDAYFKGVIYNLKLTQNDGTVIVWYDFTDSNNYFNSAIIDGNALAVDSIVPTNEINTMWVWIPRYAYQITSGYHTSTAGDIGVMFLKDDTNVGTDSTQIYEDNASNTHFVVHPAFMFDTKKLTGIWVAKFEMSGSTSALFSLPGVSALRSITVGNSFTATRNMEASARYGWPTLASGLNADGTFTTDGNGLDVHMMKNIEWGAAAYLAKSTYGKSTEISFNNSSNYYTGGALGNAYATDNVGQSTTGNVYGIYDMSGGTYEYVMGNYNNLSGSSGLNPTTINNKYIDRYGSDISGNYGDALYETSSGSGTAASWYGDYSYKVDSTWPWYGRGGDKDIGSVVGGSFCYRNYTGVANGFMSWRAVLIMGDNL